MEIIIAMLIGIAAAILGIIVALVIIFCRIKENNELLKSVYYAVRDVYARLVETLNILSEKEPKLEDLKTSEDLKPSEELKRNINIAKKFKIDTKVVGVKGTYIGEVYTIYRFDLLASIAVLIPCWSTATFRYLTVYLNDLENNFEPLEDEE